MSFCAIDKLYIIKRHLESSDVLNSLSDINVQKCYNHILDALEEIEKTELEYKRMCSM